MSHAKPAKSGKPKRDRLDIDAAVAKADKRIAKAVARDAKPTGERNEYLASIVDPSEAGKGSKVPDGNVFPSVAFQTRYVDELRTDAHGRALACHAPTLYGGGFHPGLHDAAGTVTVHAHDPASADLQVPPLGPTEYTNFEVHDIIPSQTLRSITTNFAAIRPVSFVARFTPTQAPLTAAGALYAGIAPREQMMASTNTWTTNGGSTVAGYNLPGAGALSGFSDWKSGAAYVATIRDPAQLLWRFQDNRDFEYRTTTAESWAGAGASNSPLAPVTFNTVAPWCANFDRESTFSYPAIIPAATNVVGPVESYNLMVLPGGIGVVDDSPAPPSLSPPIGDLVQIDKDFTYPWTFWAVDGADPNTAVGEVEFIVNWEAIPTVGTRSIMATTPSPSNPLELAQASNIVPSLPPASNPDNAGQPENKILRAASAAAGDLYVTATPKKAAVEGKSFLNRLLTGAGKIAASLLPGPLSMLASSGVDMLSNLAAS